ncbi:MAG: DinB family protein [Bacteroidetes bacterium]|nr:DinB family protein [Bacteroidota bacterium]
MKTNSQKQLLLQLIKEAYKSKAWHGTNLRGSIRGLSAEQAVWRPAPSRHNIWEIVVHCAYWKYAVRRQLTGEKKGSFLLKGSNWFICPENLSEKAWKADIRMLDKMHRSLCEVTAKIGPSKISRKPGGSKFTISSIVSGIACHDIYHAGQIQLIKRLMKK